MNTKNQQGIAHLILILIIAAVVAGGGYWLYQKSNLKTQIYESPSPSAVSSATPNPTAGWKTYTNTQYGFEFKYPGGWTIVGNLANPNGIVANTQDGSPDFLPLVGLLPYSNLTEYRQYLSSGWPNVYTEEHVTFAGKSASAFYASGRLNNYVVQLSDNKFLSLYAFNSISKDILSTFKFTGVVAVTNSPNVSPTTLYPSPIVNYSLECYRYPGVDKVGGKYTWYLKYFRSRLYTSWDYTAICYNKQLQQVFYLDQANPETPGGSYAFQAGVYDIIQNKFSTTEQWQTNYGTYCYDNINWSSDGKVVFSCAGAANLQRNDVYQYGLASNTVIRIKGCSAQQLQDPYQVCN